MVKEIKMSQKLPVFKKTKKGTQVFEIKNCELISIYDDFTIYPDSSAKKWRLRVFNKINGNEYDKICISHGLYSTRERALEEIERFLYRGDELIFYVIPIEFKFDLMKFVWGDEEDEYDPDDYVAASDQEMIEEAKKRLYVMTGRKINGILNGIPNGYYPVKILSSFYDACESLHIDCLPYELIEYSTVLYVNRNKAQWSCDRMCLLDKSSIFDGITPAYVYNIFKPELSEFGDICYKYEKGIFYRIA